MAQLFTLTISDNSETVNFLDATNYEVQDGGFDIGLPSTDRSYSLRRPGPWFEPTKMTYGPRSASVVLRVFGATRSAVIANINKIQRIIHTAEARKVNGTGRRCELKYAWEGATNMTYFEILGGDVVLPSDALSIAKMFVQKDNVYYIPDVTVQLDLSPFGYGHTLYSAPTASFEVPLYSVGTGVRQTGGVFVENPYAGNSNYVDIAAADVAGEQPFITKVVVNGVNASSSYSKWEQFFMGLKITPFSTSLLFEGENFSDGTPTPSTRARTTASNGSVAYWTKTTTTSPWYDDIFPAIEWNVSPSTTRGLFMAFIQSFNVLYSIHSHYAVGITDYVAQGYRYISDWYKARSASFYKLPIGIVRLPPDDVLASIGSLYPNSLGIFYAQDSGQSSVESEIDFISLLPIDDGLRVWVQRGVGSTSDLEGDLIDDSWLGTTYLNRNDSAGLTTPFIGMLGPLKLEPNVNQRIYFNSIGTSTGPSEGARSYRVRVYAVPTYKLLAF